MGLLCPVIATIPWILTGVSLPFYVPGRLLLLIAVLLFITPDLAVWDQAKLRARERAAYIASEAARAGGQAIDPADAITGTAIPVDPKDAAAAAQSYLTLGAASDRCAAATTKTCMRGRPSQPSRASGNTRTEGVPRR
ncbi:hypothetical protein [Streptomyces chartreusis]|uniref:hypothetical protein n=1 Tax=Streptomyces chartreusis TaxID=1969 RepID=UPI003807792A